GGLSVGGVVTLLNDGAGKFGAPASVLGSGGAPSIAAGDFNGDGKLDLAVAKPFAGGRSILAGGGPGGLRSAAKFLHRPRAEFRRRRRFQRRRQTGSGCEQRRFQFAGAGE